MSTVTVAATQMACSWDRDANMARAEKLIREAARRGANVILIQELFETPYFCKDHAQPAFRSGEAPGGTSRRSSIFAALARELDVVLPVSVFERANNAFYNSVVIVDAGGAVLGSYRKSHIPEGRGYHEKFYFSPGDTGFKVFDTQVRQARRRDLLGPMVSGGGALHGVDGRGNPAVSDRDRLRAAGPGVGFERALAAHHAGPCRGQRHAGGGVESHRDGTGRKIHDDLLRLLVHRLAHREKIVAEADRGSETRADRRVRSGGRAPISAGVGRVPRPAPRAVSTRFCRSMDAAEGFAFPQDLVFVDLETTGGNAAYHRITEVGIVRVETGETVEEWSSLVNPECRIPPYIEASPASATRWSPRRRALPTSRPLVLEKLQMPAQRAPLFVAHNARFDYSFLRAEFRRARRALFAPRFCAP